MMLSVCNMEHFLISTGDNEYGTNYNEDSEYYPENGDYADNGR